MTTTSMKSGHLHWVAGGFLFCNDQGALDNHRDDGALLTGQGRGCAQEGLLEVSSVPPPDPPPKTLQDLRGWTKKTHHTLQWVCKPPRSDISVGCWNPWCWCSFEAGRNILDNKCISHPWHWWGFQQWIQKKWRNGKRSPKCWALFQKGSHAYATWKEGQLLIESVPSKIFLARIFTEFTRIIMFPYFSKRVAYLGEFFMCCQK